MLSWQESHNVFNFILLFSKRVLFLSLQIKTYLLIKQLESIQQSFTHKIKSDHQCEYWDHLHQLISCPTRITKNTSTLLDHVLTNSHDKVSQSGVIDIGLSDHQLIYCTRKVTRAKFHDHKFITIRSLKNYSKDIYIEALNEIDFPDYSEFDSVDEAYDDLVKKLTEVIDKIAPVKKIRVKSNTQEWFDDEIRQAIKICDKCFSKIQKV